MMMVMLIVCNIQVGVCIYDIWSVNEDVEYYESGNEGDQVVFLSICVVLECLKVV